MNKPVSKTNFEGTTSSNAVNTKQKTNMETKTTLVVTRNNAPWTYVLSPLKKKNPNDPVRYAFVPAPVNDKTPGFTSAEFLAHLGNDLIPLVTKQVRSKASFCSKVADAEASPKNDKGEVVGAPDPTKMQELFQKYMEDFNVRGETKASLVEEKEELVESIKEIVASTELTMEEKMSQMTTITNRIKEIDQVLAEREAKNTKED